VISGKPSLLEWSVNHSQPADVGALFAQHAHEFAYYGSGKAAFRDGLRTLQRLEQGRRDGSVLLPAYIPDAVLEPVTDCGLEPRLYELTDSLAPNMAALESRIDDSTLAVVSVNYFGFSQPAFDAIDQLASRNGCYHLEDNAHGALSVVDGRLLGTRTGVGFSSLWKLLPAPDGAVLLCNDEAVASAYEPSSITGVHDRVRTQDLQFALKSLASDLLDTSHRLKSSVHSLVTTGDAGTSTASPAQRYRAGKDRMSRLSAYVVADADPAAIRHRRRENYRAWRSVFEGHDAVTPLFDELPHGVCPQVFPVRTSVPGQLERVLADCGVDGAHTWPRLSSTVRQDDTYATATKLAAEVVVLPVHQQTDPETITSAGLEVVSRLP